MKISAKRKQNLDKLQKRIDYYFKDLDLLNKALTHSSYSNEKNIRTNENNERLEFLGDAVIGLIVSEYLYDRFEELPEGEMTKRRASIVCESSLAFAARKINREIYSFRKGEEATGGRNRDSILADAFEALAGAVFLDGGLEYVRKYLIGMFEEEVIYAISKGNLFIDYKTELQSTSKKGKIKIEYVVDKEVGPDHKRSFI